MAGSDRTIFRESAIERYKKGQEHTVLLQLATPPVIAFLWIMLLLFLGAGALAWFVQVPVTITGQGIIIAQGTTRASSEQHINVAQPSYAISQTNTMPPVSGPYLAVQATKTPLLPTRTLPTPKPQPTKAPVPSAVPTLAAQKAQPTHTSAPTTAPTFAGTASRDATLQPRQPVAAILFLPPEQRANLHTGGSATVDIDATGLHLAGTIEQIGNGLISPSDAHTRFQLNGPLAQVISVPSIMVTVQINTGSASSTYIGSMCHADIQTGTQSILSLVPGINQFIKK